jgi:hypothetical protein
MGAIRRDRQAREVDGSKETTENTLRKWKEKGTKKKKNKIIKGNGRQRRK